MADYRPHAYEYQQLEFGWPTRGVDCQAWGAAWLTDAHTKGAIHLSGRTIRLATNEPIPNPASPGLNAMQVDDAVYRLTSHKVDLEPGGIWTPKTTTGRLTTAHYAGRPFTVAIHRGRMIQRMPEVGAVNGFDGIHCVGAILDDGKSYYFDTLIRFYLPLNLADLWYAAAGVPGSSAGYAYALLARDIIPSHYEATIDPAPEAFWTYRVDGGRVVSRRKAVGAQFRTTRTCTKPATFPYGDTFRNLVRLTEGVIGKSTHPYVSPDASAIHVRGVLP
jgi:hypothetical protein